MDLAILFYCVVIMKRKEIKPSPLRKVRSKINHEEYFYSDDYGQKEIDGQDFVGVKKDVNGKTFFMLKDILEFVK